MNRNILIFGLISGLIASLNIVVMTIINHNSNTVEGSMLLGFTFMFIAFSFVFVGIKNYRDKFNGGVISLGRAFKIGALIALVASTLYVIAWLISYYLFIPDFMEKYTTHTLNELKASGANEIKLKEETANMDFYKEMYKNPLFVILFTYMEILPVGLLMSFISSLILMRKGKAELAVSG